jgi:23S rRNA (pseudouridine1915-N3)-methyltransferase
MIYINTLMVGKTDNLWRKPVQHYEERLKPFCHLDLKVVAEEGCRDQDAMRAMQQEELRLKSLLKPDDYCVILDRQGDLIDSEAVADMLQTVQANGCFGRLVCVIGGPFGLRTGEWSKARKVIALSKMTLTHQMVRPFWLEQLYRGFQILRGSKYHKS